VTDLNDTIRKVYNRACQRLVLFFIDRPLPRATEKEAEAIESLKAAFKDMVPGAIGHSPPSETEWMDNVQRLRQLVLSDNPRRFLRWDVILRSMFVNHAPYIDAELSYLRGRPDWEARWERAVLESRVGHPIPYRKYPSSSENLIHHAYHMARFEEQTQRNVADFDVVLEFGGGYGSMCRLLHRLGFSGTYVLYDLPHFSLLQHFYLTSLGLPVSIAGAITPSADGIICVSDTNRVNDVLPDQIEGREALFIATWSLSETPIDFREEILGLVTGFSRLFIAYQDRFNQIDNRRFFHGWTDRHPQMAWCELEIEHIPRNRYLFAKQATR